MEENKIFMLGLTLEESCKNLMKLSVELNNIAVLINGVVNEIKRLPSIGEQIEFVDNGKEDLMI